jgi:small subunit ribosomal protein S16
MVIIRLSRRGSKKRPFYHIVVADQRFSRDGRRIEQIGYFNPLAKGVEKPLEFDLVRYEHWKGLGAQPSSVVKKLYNDMKKQQIAVAA